MVYLTLAHFVKNRKILILFFIRQTNYSIDNILFCQVNIFENGFPGCRHGYRGGVGFVSGQE